MLASMDAEEIAYQMALDVVESEEGTARRQGVPTVTETMAVPKSHRVSAQDPQWFAKLEKLAGH